jgi:oxygen-independent coproporphyrinogen-3 oxidase
MDYSYQQADKCIDALCLEVTEHKLFFNNRKFNSVYIGGGTPTTLAPGQLERIMRSLPESFNIASDAEYTLEVNPNTASRELFKMIREFGVNRLSLGVQSFEQPVLNALGRLHNAKDAAVAVEIARSAGFTNVGIDLIYGIPGQSVSQWTQTLETAVFIRPEHISAYCLSLDEGSRFMRAAKSGYFALPDDDYVVAMQDQIEVMLGIAGYGRYEISNYCLPGYHCKHNLNYWQRGEYLGIGPSAWSFIEGKRYRTIADVKAYSERLNVGLSVREHEESIDSRQALSETLMLGLRMTDGVDLASFGRMFGDNALTKLGRNAGLMVSAGLLHMDAGRISLTKRGFLLADEVLARLDL